MQTWINSFIALCCLLLTGVATADDQQAKNHLVDASLMFATLDAGGSDNFHTGRMLQINYNYYFKPWLAASAGVIVTEEIAEEPQQDIAGEFRGIIQTNALVLGLRPEYAFSDRNRVYGRTSVLAYFSELQVEQFFGSGLPNDTTSDTTDGYGYLVGIGWAHSFTKRISMQLELSHMAQLDLFDESSRSFDLKSNSFGLGIGYAF